MIDRRLALRVGAAVVGVTLLALCLYWLAHAAPDAWRALRGFDTRLLAPLLALVVIDYTLRFLRWRWLLRLASGERVPLWLDAGLFLAGNAMVLTPGRAGEWVKSLYAERLLGIPIARTAPIPLLERLVDSVAMLALVALGALIFDTRLCLLATPALLIAGAIVWSRRGVVARRLDSLRAGRLRPVLESPLYRPGVVGGAFALGLVAWSLECVAFCLVLAGLGLRFDLDLVAKAAFIYPAATLLGTISFLPGGLGVSEGGIAGMLQALLGAGAGLATAAALLIRFAIVGLGVLSGLPSFLLLGQRSLRTPRRPIAAPDEAVELAACRAA